MLNCISRFFNDKNKLYIANTNPAVENLRQKINVDHSEFNTIASVLSNRNTIECDFLIIDECSTVSNRDMVKLLGKIHFDYLILVGDVYQIESIYFGNWFKIIKYFMPSTSVFELKEPFRTQNRNLLSFWNSVRNIDNIISNIVAYKFTKKIDNSISIPNSDDEIILCLNYDGLYGVNNINRFLQNCNQNKKYILKFYSYGVGDPILFNDSNRFSPLLHNNLKGRIYDINENDEELVFQVEVDKFIDEADVQEYDDLKCVKTDKETKKSVVEFSVTKDDNSDDDIDDFTNVMPFQIAYAVSIHKAQGLEYDSVKVIITSDSEEKISHNIFYTAITRAKNKLIVYWTPETMKKVIKSFESKDGYSDASI